MTPTVCFYAFPDGEPFVAFGVSFHLPVKPEGMLNLETLLGLGGTLLFQPF
jgi:hypothetical protein